MNITALNAVIAAAARHGFTVELNTASLVSVRRVTSAMVEEIATRATPEFALTAIQRAASPQPENYFTLDEAIYAASSLPWRVTEERGATIVRAEDSGVEVSEFDENDRELLAGMTEEDAILAAHCVTQLPRLVAAVDNIIAEDKASRYILDPLYQAVAAAKRVPGKVVVS